ncbi:class 1b ribonucleoside-diphosphate reductase subunit alpha [Paenibacillus sp. SI8]|uniref:class 1b ribonucleoside-diphosphate reductase subunit alpha n=1 Tax=unclassified Paenibacillus TaxID=185978 RepID=UPI0034663EA6
MQRGEDGFYRLEKDGEAAAEFMREVAGRSMTFGSVIERLRYLVENDYYYDVFTQYDDTQLADIHAITAAYDFRFASYMAASKFYKDYALQTNNKTLYLEDYAQHVSIVALYLGQGDYPRAVRLARSMMEQRYQPATPTFLNAGRARRGEMVSCFLLEADDSLNSINYTESTAKQLSKIGGGVAINLSKIRGRGEAIKGIDGIAKGVVPVAKQLELGFAYADQLGQRPGAGAVYYNVFGWDVLEFLDTKKINAEEDIRLNRISIGLIAPSKFFELASAGLPFYMFAPHTVHRTYGVHLDDMNMAEMYDLLVANPHVKKRSMDARDMLTLIASTQLQSGYPYLFFKDNANRVHPLKALGSVKMTNLCTEIFQLQETSTIGDYGDGDVIQRDISCNLGSLNIANVMVTGKLRESVQDGIEALTVVSDISRIPNAPGVRKANDELHSVGLGVMNLHGFLAKNKIAYESEEARDFCRTFFAAMNFYSIEASMNMAANRGETFKGFGETAYADGSYFAPYLTEDFAPRTERVRELFVGVALPSPRDWQELMRNVADHGLYHAYRLAIAPTQSIAYIQNATSSVMPITQVIERRLYGNGETFYPAPYLTSDNQWFYKSAYNVDQYKLIDLIAEIQPHIDQGISTILYVDSDVSTRELGRLYAYAHHRGLKSLYYTRTNRIDPSECTSCAI